jgi:hypothetical protein
MDELEDDLLKNIDKNEQIKLWNEHQQARNARIVPKTKILPDGLEKLQAEEARLREQPGNKRVVELQTEVAWLKRNDRDCKMLAKIKREQNRLRKRHENLAKEEEEEAIPEQQEECSICMDRHQDMRVNPDGCGHKFCSTCIRQVAKCPLCRAPIKKRVPL